MSIEVHIEETVNEQESHAARVKEWTHQGWEIFSHHVVHVPKIGNAARDAILYSTMLVRNTAHRVENSALAEVVRKNSKMIERLDSRLRVVETTLDDDTGPNERVYSVVEPLSRIDIITDALVEDQERGL